MAAARVWAQHCVLDDNHSKTGLNLLFGTPLGYFRHYRLMLLHYFCRRIATVERREASVPRHGTQGASLGAWYAALWRAPTGGSHAPERFSALRPPLVRGE